jgi:SAM-dependent methyltransferase
MVMNDSADNNDSVARDRSDGAVKYYKRDFWGEENLKFTRPHFRMRKCARLINKMTRGRELDLLDIGCGPAALKNLLEDNIHYYGIDIAIQEPAPYLLEADLLASPIKFGDKQFDIVVVQGVFEYVGEFQSRKFAEISELLRPGGTFIVSYMNFGHHKKEIYWPYSNVQQIRDFRESLARNFQIDRSFPVGHNWNHSAPQKSWLQAIQMNMNLNIPVVSPVLASEYFFICSPRTGSAAP